MADNENTSNNQPPPATPDVIIPLQCVDQYIHVRGTSTVHNPRVPISVAPAPTPQPPAQPSGQGGAQPPPAKK